MKHILVITRSGFRLGLAPVIIIGLVAFAMFGMAIITDGNIGAAPFRPEPVFALMVMFAALGALLSLAGLALGSSLYLAALFGGRMPEGAVAIVLGTLFAVLTSSLIILLRAPAGALACQTTGWAAQAICATNTALETTEAGFQAWRILIGVIMLYASIAGLVIGGAVAELRGITIVAERKVIMPKHMLRRVAITRAEWLRRLADEKLQQQAQPVADGK
jgi:hypothetical protein